MAGLSHGTLIINLSTASCSASSNTWELYEENNWIIQLVRYCFTKFYGPKKDEVPNRLCKTGGGYARQNL